MTQEELAYLVKVNDRDLRELKKNIDTVNKAADEDLGKASTSADSHLRKINKGALIAAGGLGIALVGAAKNAYNDLAEGNKVAAQTTAVLKSTGAQAHITGKGVDNLANSISAYSGLDDEAVASGENMLLTFTRIRNETGKGNDIFNQSTKILADMSVALGTDMPKSAIQLGKALNDPIKGVSALSRVGVTFDEATKKQIKSLVEHGKVAEAQKIILHELNTEFGGSAKAAGETIPGQLAIARNAFDNLSSSLLQSLLPAITGLTGLLQDATRFMSEHQHATKVVIVAIAGLAVGVFAINAAMKVWNAGMIVAKLTMIGLGETATLTDKLMRLTLIGALITLATMLVLAYTKSETFRNIVNAALAAVRDAALVFVRFISERIPGAFQTVLNWLRSNWPLIATIISGPFAPLVALATNAFGVRSALVGAFGTIKTRASEIIGDVVGFFRSMPARIGDAVQETAGEGWKRVKAALADIFGPVWKFVKRLFGINSPSTVFHELGSQLVAGFVNGMTDNAGKVKDAIFGTFSGRVFNSLGGFWDSLTGFFGHGAGPPPPDVQQLANFIGANVRAPVGTGGIAGGSASAGGLVPQVVAALRFAHAHGWFPGGGLMSGVTSGWRSYAEQAALYDRYLHGGPLAARPGTSSHESGQAVDVQNYGLFGAIMAMAPPGARLFNRLGAIDPVHFSISGYDQGGWLPPGLTLAVNKTGRPERVLSPDEMHGAPLVYIHELHVRDESDIDKIGSAVQRALGVK